MLARNEKYQQVLDCCMKLKVHLIRFRLHHLVEAHMCDVFVMAQWLAKLPSDYYSLLIVNEKWGVNVPWSWWGWSISYHYLYKAATWMYSDDLLVPWTSDPLIISFMCMAKM